MVLRAADECDSLCAMDEDAMDDQGLHPAIGIKPDVGMSRSFQGVGDVRKRVETVMERLNLLQADTAAKGGAPADEGVKVLCVDEGIDAAPKVFVLVLAGKTPTRKDEQRILMLLRLRGEVGPESLRRTGMDGSKHYPYAFSHFTLTTTITGKKRLHRGRIEKT
jgi:hypothetical protein